MSKGKRESRRRYPIGAELWSDGGAHFRVWAPKAKRIELVIENGGSHAMQPDENGYWSAAAVAQAGTLYRFRIDGSDTLYPDPASRFQPQGVHGPSAVIDAQTFRWTDREWRGVKMRGQVLYEMHIGTFTKVGTWRAAISELPELASTGITTIEMMPVAEFAGEFGWGYDGVDLFAPTRNYGTPDDLRAFVDAAHASGIGVILDVVYNHLGPEGNYLRQFSDDYFTDRYETEWGDPLNFDGPNSEPVREFFITNGRYWIDEFHFDGFRFDATQCVFDSSDDYIIGAITRAAREAAGERSIIAIAENEPQHTKLVRPRGEGGDNLDGLWNDDWHHSAIVALTGRNEAYYTDHAGTPQEFISAAKYGYLFQGQRYEWQDKSRGTPSFGVPPEKFITFIENHDQVSNCAFGKRVRSETGPAKYRAMTALLLLGPSTPLLFQGQEFGATTPFIYFNDASDELRGPIQKGRFEFLKQFPSVAAAAEETPLPAPADRETFEKSKLNFGEREKFSQIYDLHRDLLKLRHAQPLLREPRAGGYDGAVLGSDAFLLRYFGESANDLLLLVNFGKRAALRPASEPLLAPPLDARWKTLWSSESPRYGGTGATDVVTEKGWILPAQAAVLLKAESRK
ncbi:MAG: malto-oligosyltrehalose trehalohydrolase [Chthoniobacterales bacterium]